MFCTAVRFVSFVTVTIGLWLAGGAIYAAKAAPDMGLTVADNVQAQALFAGAALFALGWIGLFCHIDKAR